MLLSKINENLVNDYDVLDFIISVEGDPSWLFVIWAPKARNYATEQIQTKVISVVFFPDT